MHLESLYAYIYATCIDIYKTYKYTVYNIYKKLLYVPIVAIYTHMRPRSSICIGPIYMINVLYDGRYLKEFPDMIMSLGR